jgi:hypothetical protein
MKLSFQQRWTAPAAFNKTNLIISGIVFLFGLIVFCSIVFGRILTDIQSHAEVVKLMYDGTFPVPGNFLYFLAIGLFSFFSANLSYIYLSSCVVLGAALSAKYMSGYILFREQLGKLVHRGTDYSSIISVVLAVSFLFITNFPTRYYWVGNLPAVTWHNSTTIFLFPVAILLYYSSSRFLITGDKKALRNTLILSVIGILIKPNFFIVQWPVFCIMVLLRFGLKDHLKAIIIYSCMLVALFLAQTAYLFIYQASGNFETTYSSVSVQLGMLEAWQKKSKNIPLSFIASATFPIAVLVLHFRHCLRDPHYRYAFSMFVLSMIAFVLFVEKTADNEHITAYNFIWNMILTMFFWFAASALVSVRAAFARDRFSFKDYFLFFLLFLHTASGLVYLGKMLILKDYR